MHYPGHENWQGMSYGLLDETPTLTRTPSNPTIGDYLAEFQDRNRAWRESLKFPSFTPNSGRLHLEESIDPAADPILGQPRRPVLNTMPLDGDGETPGDPPGGLVGNIDGPLDLGAKYGLMGFMAPIPGLGLLGSAIGNAQSAANAGAIAGNSFGIGKDALDFSILSGVLNDISFGRLGNSIADQLGALGHEIGYSPDGDFFDLDDAPDAKDPDSGFTMADLDAMSKAASVAEVAKAFDPLGQYYDPFGDQAGYGGDYDETDDQEMGADDYGDYE